MPQLIHLCFEEHTRGVKRNWIFLIWVEAEGSEAWESLEKMPPSTMCIGFIWIINAVTNCLSWTWPRSSNLLLQAESTLSTLVLSVSAVTKSPVPFWLSSAHVLVETFHVALKSLAVFSVGSVLTSVAGTLHAWAIFLCSSLGRLFSLLPP